MRIAAEVAERKRLHPEDFCPTKKCLWRTGGGHCPRHADRQHVPVEDDARDCLSLAVHGRTRNTEES